MVSRILRIICELRFVATKLQPVSTGSSSVHSSVQIVDLSEQARTFLCSGTGYDVYVQQIDNVMNHIERLTSDQEPDRVVALTSLPSKKRRLNSRITRAAAPALGRVLSSPTRRQCSISPTRGLVPEHRSQPALRSASFQSNSTVRDVTSPRSFFGSESVCSLTPARANRIERLLLDLKKKRSGRPVVQSIEELNVKLLNKSKEQEDWWFRGQDNDDSCPATAELLQLVSFVKILDKKHNAQRFIMLRQVAEMIDQETERRRETIHQTTLAQNQTCKSTAINEIYNILKLAAPSHLPDNCITRGEFTKLALQAEKWKRLNPGFVFCFIDGSSSKLLISRIRCKILTKS